MRRAASSLSKDQSPQTRLKAYLAALPAPARRAARQIRDAIVAAAPDAEEGFGYGIPAFKLDGRVLVYYAAWKEHTSLYPLTPAIRREHADLLSRYETSKGTIRFPLAKPVPTGLIRKLVKTRVAEARAAGKRRRRL